MARSSSRRVHFPWITWMNTSWPPVWQGHLRMRWSSCPLSRLGRPSRAHQTHLGPVLSALLGGTPSPAAVGQAQLLERDVEGNLARPSDVHDRILEGDLHHEPVEQRAPHDRERLDVDRGDLAVVD